MKPVIEYLASPLANIINNCINKMYFLSNGKQRKSYLFQKSGLQLQQSDFRPISILPVMSKVFERIILNQMNQYIEEKAVTNLRNLDIVADIQPSLYY